MPSACEQLMKCDAMEWKHTENVSFSEYESNVQYSNSKRKNENKQNLIKKNKWKFLFIKEYANFPNFPPSQNANHKVFLSADFKDHIERLAHC